MALSVSGFPENSALAQDSDPNSTATTIRGLFSANSGNSLATKVTPANNTIPTSSHITGEDFQQVYDTAQVPLHRPEHLPSIPRPRQVSLTSGTSRRTPPPPASGVRQQYQHQPQRLDLASNNSPPTRTSSTMHHTSQHGLPQPPAVKVHHDWATNSSTAGVSFSTPSSSSRPLPTIPPTMQTVNPTPTSSSTNSGPIVESSRKAEARAASAVPGASTMSVGSSSSSAAGSSSIPVEYPPATSSSTSASGPISISPSTSRTLPTRTSPTKIIPPASSSSFAGPSSAIPISTSPPTFSTPQLPQLSLNTTRPRAQTTAPITHPLPQANAGFRSQTMSTTTEFVQSPLSASIPLSNAQSSSLSSSPPQAPPATQGLSGPRPLPRIPPGGGPPASTPIAGPSTLPAVASSSKVGAAVGVTYVSGSKTVTTTVAGGSGSSAASSSSSSSSSAAGPSTPRKGVMKPKRPRTSPGPEAPGNNLAGLLASGSGAGGSGLGPSLTRSGSVTRSMIAAPSSSPPSSYNTGSSPAVSSLSITTSILKRTTSASVSGVTPILSSASTNSASTSSYSARSSPPKDTPPTSGPSTGLPTGTNPLLKSLPVTSQPTGNQPPATAPLVPTSGMPPRSRSQSRTRTRVTLPPSPPSHVAAQGQASTSSQPARRTLQLHQPVPVASTSWGSMVIAASTSASSSSSNTSVSTSTTHPSLPAGASMMRRGSATAAAIITGNSSTSTPATTPPSTPGPSRSKPLPTGYGSKHSSTLSSGGGLPLGQSSSMSSISGGRYSSTSHGHGPLPPRPGGTGAATAAAMLYAAVPSPASPSHTPAGGSKVHSRTNSQTQSQMFNSRPTTGTTTSNSRSASLSRETSLTGLGGVAAGGGSRSASRSNSKSRANSINANLPNLPSISTTVGGRGTFKPGSTASPAASPRLGYAPQPAFIVASSPVSGMPSPISPDRNREASPFGAARATSPIGASAGSRATSPLGARARARATSPGGQRLFASSLGRKGKGVDWGSDEDEQEVTGKEQTKERGDWMYGSQTSGSQPVKTVASNPSATSTTVRRPLPGVDTRKEQEERRLILQREEKRNEERRKREEKRLEEKAKEKPSRAGKKETYKDEEDDEMHNHPTLGRMSSDSEIGRTSREQKKRQSILRGSENGDLQLAGDGEAFVNDSDYEPILSRSPSPMQYARPASRNSFSSSIGSSYEQSRGINDDDDAHHERARNRSRRRNGPAVDKTRAAQLLSYRKSYRGVTAPPELSDPPKPRSSSLSSGRGIASPAPRHSASPSSSLRHLEGMAGQWKPGIDIGEADMLEEQELNRSPSPIRYARRNSFDATVEILDLENDLAASPPVERGRRGTVKSRGRASIDSKDLLEDYGYGYGGGFEREQDVVRQQPRVEESEKSHWSDGETLHEKPKKKTKKTKKGDKPSQLGALATVGAILGMGDGEKSPKKDKKEKPKKRERRHKDDDQTATFGTSSSGSLRTSRGGSYSNAFAQSVSTLGGSVIDISSLPPTPPQHAPTNGQSKMPEVSMQMQVLEPAGRRDSDEKIGGNLKRLRTYTFDSYEPPSSLGGSLGGLPVVNVTVERSKTDSKSHKRRSYSQGQIEVLASEKSHGNNTWTSKFQPLRGQQSVNDLSNKALPPPPDVQPRRTESPLQLESHRQTPPSSWIPRKRSSVNDHEDSSSSVEGSNRSRKTSGTGPSLSAVNLVKTLKFGPSVPVERKAGRGGGVWIKNSSGSSVQ